MTGYELYDLMLNCSPNISQNQVKVLNYDDATFDVCCRLISWYRQYKNDFKDVRVEATHPIIPVLGITENDRVFYIPHGDRKGQIRIRAIQCPNGYLGDDMFELDEYMLRYIKQKFDYPIEYINAYIRIKKFDI